MTNILDFLPNYPDVEDKNFYQDVYNKSEFYDLKLEKQYSVTKDFNFLDHQIFISRILSSFTLYNSMLLFHSMGTGKSGVAFAASEKILKDNFGINKVYVLTNSKDVLNNLKNELLFKFTKGKYIPDDYNILTSRRQKTIVQKNVLKINNYYFEQFHYISKEIMRLKTTEEGREKLKEKYSNSFFILDEIHNIKDKIKGETDINKYGEIKYLFELIDNKKILLMSGTPMKDQANEITSILNLILPIDKQFKGEGILNQYSNFDKRYMANNKFVNNIDEFNDKIKGKISYLKNVSNINKTFKGKIIKGLKYFKVFELEMTGLQLEKYKEAYDKDTRGVSISEDEEEKTGLYNNSRQSINCVYPDGSYGGQIIENVESGFNKYINVGRQNKLVPQYSREFGDDIENLKEFSAKYYEIIKNIKENDNMCHFVYSKLVNGSGIVLLTLLLEKYLGYTRYQPRGSVVGNIQTEGKRYILLSSDTDSYLKEQLIKEFNQEKNKNGEYIRVIFGTYVIKEGLSFFSIQKIHICTPHWNYSETEQIIARAIRYDSHQYLDEDITIEIILYVCNNEDIDSIDVKMYKKAEEKDIRIKSVEKVLKENAIDCQLFKERNKREIDYSRECEYDLCEYTCKDIDLTKLEIDKTTQNIYYKDEELKEIIKKLYKKYFYLTLQDLDNYLRKNNIYEILITMNYFINNNIIVYNKYGIRSFIREKDDIFYLSENIDEDNESINYTYNEDIIRELNYSIFNNRYIFEKLSDSKINMSEKKILLEYLDKDTIEDLIKNSVIIKRNKTRETSLCKFILDRYEDKYDYLTINGKNVYIINYYNLICLYDDENTWKECNDEIIKYINQIEERKIRKSRDLGFLYYGIIRTTNKFEESTFILKTLPKEEISINSFEQLKSLCNNKTKITCTFKDGEVVKNLVCNPKKVFEDRVILNFKKNINIIVLDNFMETKIVMYNEVDKEFISLNIQIDARVINRGKECMNYQTNELKLILKDRVEVDTNNKKQLCLIIKELFDRNNILFYDKISKNL